MIRRTIACCLPHEFIGTPGALMHGTELLCAAGETEDEVNEHLAKLLHQFGWKKREDERWQCHAHDAGFVDATEGFTLSRERSCVYDGDKTCHHPKKGA